MNPPLVIDIYRYNPVLDFPATKAAQIIGVIHKASEGNGWTDGLYAHRRKWWMDGKIPFKFAGGQVEQLEPLWGAYHFFHGGDPAAEARHFLSVAEPDAKTLLALDWETVPGGTSATKGQAEAFINEVEQKTGRSCVVYSGNVAKERITGHDAFFAERRLWLAQYGTRYVTQQSWTHPWLWQNNGDAYGPGPHYIPGLKGLCDNSTIVEGTVHEFIDSWAGGLSFDPVVPPALDAKPVRQTGITATEFGGVGDRQRSAYGGPVDGDKPGVALPFYFTGPRLHVQVFCQDIDVLCEIVDVGPHNTQDPYWARGTRPRAEKQGGNRAGIDLTPAAMNALNVPGRESTRTTKVDWEFVP